MSDRVLPFRLLVVLGALSAFGPVPPHMMVWHSARAGGDTKTRRSRRTLALPQRCVDVLQEHQVHQRSARAIAGE